MCRGFDSRLSDRTVAHLVEQRKNDAPCFSKGTDMLSNAITDTISNILHKEGCTEIYLFGSHITGKAN